jgi:hypothetical protein
MVVGMPHWKTKGARQRGRGLRSGFTERSLRETAPEVGLLGPLPMRRLRSTWRGPFEGAFSFNQKTCGEVETSDRVKDALSYRFSIGPYTNA